MDVTEEERDIIEAFGLVSSKPRVQRMISKLVFADSMLKKEEMPIA